MAHAIEWSRLTDTERVIVQRLAMTGATTRQLATALGKSPNTVRTHLSNIQRKTGIHTRSALVVWYWSEVREREG